MSKKIQTELKTILGDVKKLIEESKQQLAISVNAAMSMLYWQIGNRINTEILRHKRADYGKEIVVSLARELTAQYGSGWSAKQLRHCIRFAKTFSDEQIVSTLWRQLTWSHIKEIIYMDDPLKRDFYIQMCKLEKWSVRTFRERIQSLLYERTAISRKPEKTILNDLELLQNEQKLSPDLVFRDPYFLDFLGLKDSYYSEKDLESSIISELQNFITELGSDFAFLAHILLYYHRKNCCRKNYIRR